MRRRAAPVEGALVAPAERCGKSCEQATRPPGGQKRDQRRLGQRRIQYMGARQVNQSRLTCGDGTPGNHWTELLDKVMRDEEDDERPKKFAPALEACAS